MNDGRLLCELCPRACKLVDGQRGLCFVRTRQGESMVLTTYGRSSGFCVDPIEKKPLNHFLPGTPILSFGTAGCNLTCKFCQNWDISKSREMDRLQDQASPQAIAATAKSLNCRSVAYTYNDPVVFLEYAVDTAKACREQGLKNVAVTAGYIMPKARPEFFEFMDAANVDLKAFSAGFYKKVCGADLEAVKDTLRWLVKESKVWVEITTLLIPGENDSEEELGAMSEWIASELGERVPLHFTAFHPDFRMTDKPRTPPETLNKARSIARRHGLKYVYTGNVHSRDGDTTFCPGCNAVLIERDWYEMLNWRLNEKAACPECGTRLDGVFEAMPGDWGAKRLPVQIRS